MASPSGRMLHQDVLGEIPEISIMDRSMKIPEDEHKQRLKEIMWSDEEYYEKLEERSLELERRMQELVMVDEEEEEEEREMLLLKMLEEPRETIGRPIKRPTEQVWEACEERKKLFDMRMSEERKREYDKLLEVQISEVSEERKKLVEKQMKLVEERREPSEKDTLEERKELSEERKELSEERKEFSERLVGDQTKISGGPRKMTMLDERMKSLEQERWRWWMMNEEHHGRTSSLMAPSKLNTKEETTGNSCVPSAGGEDDTLQSLLSKFRHIVGDSKTCESAADNFTAVRFAAGVFGKRGGHLTLDHLGIDLYIPPDAVVGDRTEIFMFAREGNKSAGEETGNKWTPPVIQCGPHGLTFNRHVILTVKHPAKNLSEWSFKFQESNTDIGETPDWKDLPQDPSAMCFAHEDKTVIFVDHFTLFGLIGKLVGAECGQSVESRRFRMGVFAEPLFRDTEIFQLRVRFWQENKQEEQAVQEKERRLGGVQLGDDKVLHLAGDGGNLSVVLEWLYPGWQVTCGDRQTIPFSSLWNDHAEMPSCTLSFERQPSEHTPRRVACRVTALQAAHPGNAVSIDVLKQLRDQQTSDFPSAATLDPEFTFLQLQPELNPTPRCVPQFPSEGQFRRLCLELDLENTEGKDWRSVAEALHLPYDFIQWTRQKNDPTRRLLDYLVAIHREESLRVLRDALVEIGHERALQMVEAMMVTSDNGTTTRELYRETRQQSSDGQPFVGMGHGDDRPSESHDTAPKEVHSPIAHSPQAACSGEANVIRHGSLPSAIQKTLSSGPTSSESTTVEKVSGERSLGDGQEADASMPLTLNVATGNTSQVPHTEEHNDSVTIPKALLQGSGCHNDYNLNQPSILNGGRGRSTLSFRATPVAQM